MRFDVLAVLVLAGLILADYLLTNGLYTSKAIELTERIYWAIAQRLP